jgi:hypothetical protein
MKWYRITLFVVLVIVLVQPLFAKWIGKGEVTGEVIESQNINNKAVFRLAITNQKIENGPELGNSNTFSFDGLNCLEITQGDSVKLQVNSSDEYGIRVEQLGFIENKSGTIEESHSFWWIVLLLGTIISAVVFLLLIRHKRKA